MKLFFCFIFLAFIYVILGIGILMMRKVFRNGKSIKK